MKNLVLIFFLISLLNLQVSKAQSPAAPQKGRTLSMENAVYSSPSFDGKVIAVLPEGQIYSISNNLYAGAFYKIRVKDKVTGYIADTDIKPLNKIKRDSEKKQASKKETEKPKKRRPFEFSRYVGPSYSLISFQEDTMGSVRKEDMSFYGAKLSGVDILIEGLLPTEINLMYAPKAPGYYEKITGVGASGWIFIADFLLQTFLPQGKDSLLFFGFGPMFRFSKFDVGARDSSTGVVTNYSMQDMTLGADFNLGYAFRVSTVAMRLEAKYFWEKKSYFGYGAALQFPF
jgi:hypothetical protein